MFALGHTGITLGAAGVAAGLESVAASSANQVLQNGSSTVVLVVGANLPDLIDKPIGLFAPALGLGTGRGIAHTLLFNLGLLAAGVYMFDHDWPWLMYIALASLGHLVLKVKNVAFFTEFRVEYGRYVEPNRVLLRCQGLTMGVVWLIDQGLFEWGC